MKKILFAVILSVSLYSCGKFLEPKSENEFMPETIEALSELLVGGVYLSSNEELDLFSLSEIFSDNISSLNYQYATISDISKATYQKHKKLYCLHPEMFNSRFDDAGAHEPQTWEKYYFKIKNCNAILDYANEVRATDPALKMRVLAETHFFRAFFYFNLVTTFSKPYNVDPTAPGVPLKLNSAYEEERMRRNTVGEVYAQIVKDLEASEKYYSQFADGKYFADVRRPSVHSLNLFRSRVALYMENWEDARKYSELVIKNKKGFALYDLNRFVATTDRPYPSYTDVENVNSETIFVYGNVRSITNYSLSPGTSTIPAKTGVNTSVAALEVSSFVASPELMNSFEDGDLRKDLYVVKECLKYPPTTPIPGFYTIYGKINIYQKNEATSGNGKFGFSFRLSEAYLNYAEACAKLNKGSEAKTKMSDLLAKRYVSGSADAVIPNIDGEELVNYILKERRKELCLEGHRWFDQKRNGMKAFEKLWYEQGKLVHKIQMNDNDPAFMLKLTVPVTENNSLLEQNQNWIKKY